MAAFGLVVLLSLFCGAFCQSEIETEIATALSAWAEDQQEETVRLDDVISKLLTHQLAENTVDWSDIGDVDDDDDDDVIHLQLAENELVGGCSHGVCKYCKKWGKKVNFCFEAKLLKLGFEMRVKANDHVLYDHKITTKNPPKLCADTKLVGKVCVQIYDVDLTKKSGCVRVSFKVLKKTFNLNIKCFKFGLDADTQMSFIQLVQKLANRQTNTLL